MTIGYDDISSFMVHDYVLGFAYPIAFPQNLITVDKLI